MTDKTAVEAMAEGIAARKGWLADEFSMRDAQAALDAIKANGFAVVPVEPTNAMRLEGVLNFGDVRDIYRAMIAAAQGGE